MDLTKQLAKHFRDVFFGGNWTDVNMHDTLADLTWEQATTRIGSLNSIAHLVFHTNYFVRAMLHVFETGVLDAHDKFSFDLPPVNSDEEWKKLTATSFSDAEKLAGFIEKMPESQLWENFTNEKYGSYYRNIHGTIEHTHYHLGQIALIKKLVREKENNSQGSGY